MESNCKLLLHEWTFNQCWRTNRRGRRCRQKFKYLRWDAGSCQKCTICGIRFSWGSIFYQPKDSRIWHCFSSEVHIEMLKWLHRQTSLQCFNFVSLNEVKWFRIPPYQLYLSSSVDDPRHDSVEYFSWEPTFYVKRSFLFGQRVSSGQAHRNPKIEHKINLFGFSARNWHSQKSRFRAYFSFQWVLHNAWGWNHCQCLH